MVEEHVGKKRRKEVRQALNMSEQLKKTLIFIFSILGACCIGALLLAYLTAFQIIPTSSFISNTVPVIILVIAMIVVAPKMSRYWAMRDEYKNHLKRYNISKEDMKALKNGEL